MMMTLTAFTVVAVQHREVKSSSTPLPAASRNWTKVLMTDAVASRNARCLDGSPGGFYIAPPSAAVADPKARWIVFHQGGGWCIGSGLKNMLVSFTCLFN